MKKQLLALTVATAFASASMAANVEVYGAMDLGMNFSHGKVTGEGSENSFTMDSGVCAPSKWGLMGKEDLGNGYSASFKLESAINADTGATKTRLFHREARLTLGTPYGDFSFGRMGSMTSSAGTYDIFMGYADVYDGGWATKSNAIGASNFFYDHGRFDNMITYASPKMAGFNVYAQYSFKNDDVEDNYGTEGKNSANRYIGAGVTYANGPLSFVAVVDSILHGHHSQYSYANKKKSIAVSVGGNYDFGSFKLFASGQWGKNEKFLGAGTTYYSWNLDDHDKSTFTDLMKGYTLHVGAQVPVCGGDLKGGVYYSRVKPMGYDTTPDHESQQLGKFEVFNVAATYEYHLSKRTDLYCGAGYVETKAKSADYKVKGFDVAVGMNHKF